MGTFVGTDGKIFFAADTLGNATVVIDGAKFVISGLQSLPDGVQYQLGISAYDPAHPEPDHEGPDARGGV